MKAPSEAQLRRAEKELRKLGKGAQRAIGGEVYLRLDGDGNRRFHYRGAGGLPGGTVGSWQEAAELRARIKEQARISVGDPATQTVLGIRGWTLERYADEAYWPEAGLILDVITRRDYARVMEKDLLPIAGQLTLAELEEQPLAIDRIKQKIVKHKTYPVSHRRAGEFPVAAADAILKVGSAILEHARVRGVVRRNPFHGIIRFKRERSRGGHSGSHRRVRPTEVMHPRTLAEVGVGMRADSAAKLIERRVVPFLIATGLRPQDICAARWSWFRDAKGWLRHITADEAVKDVGGHLLLGQPKTGRRVLYLFDAIAELLELVWQAQGEPDLDALVFSNCDGGLLDWGNWRDDVWYPALERAGLAATRATSAPGAFDPYLLRHIGATTMLHARRHHGKGNYSSQEVARQFGHSAQTLHSVYADIPEKMHGIAGLTIDKIIRRAWRQVWGPMPGDADYEENLLTTAEASVLTGIRVNALGGRLRRGTLPGERRGSRYLVSEFNLVWHGLIGPEERVRSKG
ncbi:MAG: hypothetical protein H0V84_09975 [Actinobacteria bacterium]|nr:hypothetical protein [Actinomycetota bacterium]